MRAIFAALLIASSVGAGTAQSANPASPLVVVFVENTNTPKLYVDGKLETSETYRQGLSKYIWVKNGRNRDVRLFLSRNLTVEQCQSSLAELHAVGFLRIRTFLYDRQAKVAGEIKNISTGNPFPFDGP